MTLVAVAGRRYTHTVCTYLLTGGDLGDRGDEPVELRLVEHALLQLLDGHGLRGVEHLARVRLRVRVRGRVRVSVRVRVRVKVRVKVRVRVRVRVRVG